MNEKSSKPARPKRRYLQFSLRALLMAVAVLSVLFGMLGRWLQQVRAEQQAAFEIQNMGGKVTYRWRLDQAIAWISWENQRSASRLLPADGYVDAVNFAGRHSDRITDEALAHLKPLAHLRILQLNRTKITDAGLAHLAGLTQLEYLSLIRTAITGSGFEHLERLKGLQTLNLALTRFDDAGLRHIEGWTNLRDLNLTGTAITDAGLRHLRKLHGLQRLILNDTSVTTAAVNQLREALPNALIVRSQPGAVREKGVRHLFSSGRPFWP